jgi:hypothetical protein
LEEKLEDSKTESREAEANFQKKLEVENDNHERQLEEMKEEKDKLEEDCRRVTEELIQEKEKEVKEILNKQEEEKKTLEEKMAHLKNQNIKKKWAIALILVFALIVCLFLKLNDEGKFQEFQKNTEEKANHGQKELKSVNDKYEHLLKQMSEKETEYRKLVQQRDAETKQFLQKESETQIQLDDIEITKKFEDLENLLKESEDSLEKATLTNQFWIVVWIVTIVGIVFSLQITRNQLPRLKTGTTEMQSNNLQSKKQETFQNIKDQTLVSGIVHRAIEM